MKINSNEFDRRITVQKNQPNNDEYLNVIDNWQDYYNCSAGIITSGGNVSTDDARTDYNTEFEIKVRYCKKAIAIIPKLYRVICQGVIYKIIAVTDVNLAHQIIKIKVVIDNE